jgi:acetolactate synthase-1/2/3 large subunit
MKAGEAIAEILKREGVEIIFGYPVNHIALIDLVALVLPARTLAAIGGGRESKTA